MTRVFSGPLHVAYCQAYVYGLDRYDNKMEDCFRAQENGLCGAGVPGALFLITGLHTGLVGFTVDVLNAPPPLDDTWEEIVEASLYVDPEIENLALVEWGGEVYPVPLRPGSYRVRYCARGMDLAHNHGVVFEEEDIVDFYYLAFWPAEAATDRVIKQTSKEAAYWHGALSVKQKRPTEGTP
jgi:hypothetical protein